VLGSEREDSNRRKANSWSGGGSPVKIRCNNCQAVFNVADEKIRKDRSFRVTCSKCSRPITVEPQRGGQKEVPLGVGVTLAEVADPPTAIVADVDVTGAYDSPLEVLE
jgi:predicted Zn finger-like uncharacterized protein